MKKKLGFIIASMLLTFIIQPNTYEVKASCNHVWSEWSQWLPATCGDEGYEDRYCIKCYETEERKIPATGNHNWDEWIITDTPNCLNSGRRVRYCLGCTASQEETLPMTPNVHTYTQWIASSYPTIFNQGEQSRICIYCGYKESKSLPKLSSRVTLRKNTIKIKKKKSYTLKIKTFTTGDKISKWVSSNKKVATVNKKGKIQGKKKGTAIVTVYMKSGAKASCRVSVK